MADFHVEFATVCASNIYWSAEVKSTSIHLSYTVEYTRLPPSADVQYGWTCTCRGFRFHGKCKHIDAVADQRCDWGASLDVRSECSSCPVCGGPVEFVRVAV